MKNIWLINLFGTPCAPSSFCPDNSLATLAASLKQSGYSPKIIDLQTLTKCKEFIPKKLGEQVEMYVQLLTQDPNDPFALKQIKLLNSDLEKHQLGVVNELSKGLVNRFNRENPLFLGFKIYSGEGAMLTRYLIKSLKNHISSPMVGGGPVVRVLETDTLDHITELDYLLNGEADRSIVQFAEYCEKQRRREDVAGLVYRDNGQTLSNPVDTISNLNQVPLPCYDKEIYPACHELNEKINVFQIDETRGCPNKCSFCVHPRINGNIVRMRDPKLVVDHIEDLQKQFGAYAFRFTGSNTPKKFMRAFAKEVLSRGLNIIYSCYTSINMISIEELEFFKSSGLVGLFIGIETLDQDILKNIINKKGQELEKVERVIKECKKQKIFLTTSWINPMPGVKDHSTEEFKKFVIKNFSNNEYSSVMLVPGVLIPGTPWYEEPDKFGFEIIDDFQLKSDYVNMVFRLFLPRVLVGEAAFRYNNKSFQEHSMETDAINHELAQHDVLLSITDDWMLMGRLSGESLSDFKSSCIKSLMSGQYDEIKSMVVKINQCGLDNANKKYNPIAA